MNNFKQIHKAALVAGALGTALAGQASGQDNQLCQSGERQQQKNWTLDLTGLAGFNGTTVLGVKQHVIKGIDEVNSLASSQLKPVADNGDLVLSTGDTGVAYAAGRVTDLTGGGQSVRTNAYGVERYLADGGATKQGWEITFEFKDTGVTFTNVDANNANWDHRAPNSGVLIVYAGKTGVGGMADIETGEHVRAPNKTVIGQFHICTDCSGSGGVAHPTTNDGSEDATYILDPGTAPAGVWLDANGNDLSLPGAQLRIHVDTNFDGNPGNAVNPFSYKPPLFIQDGVDQFGVSECGNTVNDTCVRNDGSATISAVVPYCGIHKWYFGKQNPPFNSDNPKLPLPPIATIQVKDEFADRPNLKANFLQGLWNPARKDNGDKFGVGHYSCYGVSAFGSPGKVNFETTNFGLDTAQVGVPRELCISAHKDAVGNPIPAAPAAEPAYLCYGASSKQDGFPQVHQIEDLNLHFAQTNLPTTDRSIKGLAMFCTPVGLKGNPAPNISQEVQADPLTWMHKACYDIPDKVYPNPFIKVNLLDDFIQAAVGQDIVFSAERERRFCEPAIKLP